MARCWSGPPRLPTFNLVCNLWNSNFVGPPPPPNLANVPCLLTLGDRVSVSIPGITLVAFVCVGKGTDARDSFNAGGPGVVECPAGSGRYYQIINVDDVGKGYANEYRQITVQKTGNWPTPIP